MALRKDAEWVPSPNFSKRQKRDISVLVIHATATSGIDSPREWLTSAMSKVSAHYLIGLDGRVLQLVDDRNVAWHAGQSEWNGKQAVNEFSIGIELVNPNDGSPHPEAQLAACYKLAIAICREFNIQVKDVVGHKEVSPGRKTDPAGLDMNDFRITLAQLMEASK